MLKYLLPILSALILGGCFFEKTPMPLHNVYWKLVELKDENVQKMDNRPGPYLFFHTNDRSLHGSDGCNTLQGEYRQDEKGFRFINIRSSRIYCEAQMEQAETFLQSLGAAEKIEIDGDTLILYSGQNELARFEARE